LRVRQTNAINVAIGGVRVENCIQEWGVARGHVTIRNKLALWAFSTPNSDLKNIKIEITMRKENVIEILNRGIKCRRILTNPGK
jgi:hypothetical protein